MMRFWCGSESTLGGPIGGCDRLSNRGRIAAAEDQVDREGWRAFAERDLAAARALYLAARLLANTEEALTWLESLPK